MGGSGVVHGQNTDNQAPLALVCPVLVAAWSQKTQQKMSGARGMKLRAVKGPHSHFQMLR